jgi:predicted NAD/FAD-dependent oxidoreductase
MKSADAPSAATQGALDDRAVSIGEIIGRVQTTRLIMASKCAVIGAGIAGLSAATALRQQGHEVVVFDRARGPGGRAATRRVDGIDMPKAARGATLAFDHGAQYFTVRDPRFQSIVDGWLRDRVVGVWDGRIVSFDSEGWEDLATETTRYVGLPGMSAMAEAMAGELDVRYGQGIESLAPLQREFDRVILAIPAAQAKPLVAHVPALSARLATLVTRPCWAVLAAFDERVPARFDGAFVHGSPLGWIARNQSKPKREWKVDAWVLHATPAWSQAHVDDDPEVVGSFLMEAFHDLIPNGLPHAFYASAHRWRHATVDPPLAAGAIHDAASRITLCGDWCLGTRIEDAYLSGLAAARGEGDHEATKS